MNVEELDRMLFELTDLEIKLMDKDLTEDMIRSRILSRPSPGQTMTITPPSNYHYTLEGDVLRLNVTGEVFAISRHTRFAKMVKHTHTAAPFIKKHSW